MPPGRRRDPFARQVLGTYRPPPPTDDDQVVVRGGCPRCGLSRLPLDNDGRLAPHTQPAGSPAGTCPGSGEPPTGPGEAQRITPGEAGAEAGGAS